MIKAKQTKDFFSRTPELKKYYDAGNSERERPRLCEPPEKHKADQMNLFYSALKNSHLIF